MSSTADDMRTWGLVSAAELERVVVVSPHPDDAVLGCAQLMSAHPGCTVATVFAEPARLCYEDSGYQHIPGLLAWRIAPLFRRAGRP
ncbi:MAG: hypothetical protein U0V73_00560 [Acidimicrobiia bacterium]